MKYIYLSIIIFFTYSNAFTQTSELLDFYVDGEDVVFEVDIKPIYSMKERYEINLFYRIITQNRSTENRMRLNDRRKINFSSSDIPVVEPGKSSFRVDINKYLADLIGSEGTFQFFVDSKLSFIPVELGMKEKFKPGKEIILGLKGLPGLSQTYLEKDPSINYSYLIRSKTSSKEIRGNLQKKMYGPLYLLTTGPIEKLDKGEYSISVTSNKYGNDSDTHTFNIKKSSILIPIAVGVIGGVIYFVVGGDDSGSGKGKLPLLPNPPDPNG